jgi:hypothetical protein
MRIVFTLTIIGIASTAATAGDTYVNGYTKKDGTYVQPYHRTEPDNTKLNNYSTQGNVNPYTGQAGTVNPNSYGNGYGNYNNQYGNGRKY